MRIFSDNLSAATNRVIFPVVEKIPNNPLIGEVVYLNVEPYQCLMLYTGNDWVELYSTDNNLWEEQIAEQEQTVFELETAYPTNGTSIIVYKDGRRLPPECVIEISPHHVGYREFDDEGESIILDGGEKFEFQIFNCRRTSTFDVKAFNRRVK